MTIAYQSHQIYLWSIDRIQKAADFFAYQGAFKNLLNHSLHSHNSRQDRNQSEMRSHGKINSKKPMWLSSCNRARTSLTFAKGDQKKQVTAPKMIERIKYIRSNRNDRNNFEMCKHSKEWLVNYQTNTLPNVL